MDYINDIILHLMYNYKVSIAVCMVTLSYILLYPQSPGDHDENKQQLTTSNKDTTVKSHKYPTMIQMIGESLTINQIKVRVNKGDYVIYPVAKHDWIMVMLKTMATRNYLVDLNVEELIKSKLSVKMWNNLQETRVSDHIKYLKFMNEYYQCCIDNQSTKL